MKTRDSLGPIPLRVIKLSLMEFSEPLCPIFNEIISTGVYPDRLKIARVVPIHKGDSKSDPKNYRPISIVPIIGKIFECLIYDRLVEFLEQENIICENQFGFRKHKNTEQAILKFFDFISSTYQIGGYSSCIFADLKKAFDTVNHNFLCNKLLSYGIRGVSNDLIRSFLTNRKQFVQIDDCKSEVLPCDRGVPQGSTLGPLLFSLYINDLSKVMHECDLVLYADDIVLHRRNSSLQTLELEMNESMFRFNDYCNYNYLTVNNKKTVHIEFSTLSPSNGIVIKNGNSIIQQVSEFKYLGVIIDKNLKHFQHLDYLVVYMKKQIGILSNIGKLFNFKACISYYYSYIYSKLNYCIIVWGGVLIAHGYSNKLKKVHNRLVKLLFGRFFSFKHSDELFAPLKFLKFIDIYRYSVMITLYKINNNIIIPFMFRNFVSNNFQYGTIPEEQF